MNQKESFSSLFALEAAKPQTTDNGYWKVMVVDDEPDIHAVMRLALKDVVVKGRTLQLFDADSAEAAKVLLAEHSDIALILLDVVMERKKAGLELVRYIRHDLQNSILQVVLVTGQPGYAPRPTVVVEYDINGYLLKSELTTDKIFFSVYAALHIYQIMGNLDRQGKQLAAQAKILLKKEEALKNSLVEKDALLREVHHRVKNNMAAIIGLFNLHRQALDDPQSQTVLSELSSRVRAMSLVHEKLYRSKSLAKIDFQDYIQSLISHLRTSFGSPTINCDIQASGVEMPLDLAVPCGMIINELVINALKYAFPQKGPTPGKGSDRIEVVMSHNNGTFVLSIADNGVGLPAGFDLNRTKTLGLALVRMLGQHQLGGRYEIDHRNGTRFTLTFSLRKGRTISSSVPL